MQERREKLDGKKMYVFDKACIDLILRATAIVDDDCDEWCGAGRK